LGLLVSASRSIIYAGGGSSAAIRAAAAQLNQEINAESSSKRALDDAAIDAQRRSIGRGG
jgi:hypothetical protein